MARAYGWNAKLLIAEESSYGTLSNGTYTQVPFASSTIDSEQGLIASNVLGLGRDPTTPFQDVINVGGELVVPVDLRNIGIWLKATLCCMIGYKEGKRTPLDSKESLFTLEQIDQNEEWPLLLSVAWLSGTKDISIFADTKKILEVCSEYAETGIEKLINTYPFTEVFKDGSLITNKEPEDFKHEILTAISALKNEYLEDLI